MRRKFPFFLAAFFLIILSFFSYIFYEFIYSTLKINTRPPDHHVPPSYVRATNPTFSPLPPRPPSPPPTVQLSPPPVTNGYVVVKCEGRLGNLMFEWASTVAIASRLNATACMLCMKFENSYASYVEMKKMFRRPPKLCPDAFNAAFPMRIERGFGIYDQLFLEKIPFGTGIQIGTFLQSHKYWKGIDIRQNFTFYKPIPYKARALVQSIFGTDSIAIGVHVRRGDKVRDDVERHIIPNATFFEKAMNECRKNYGSNTRFVVISDEPEWCHNQTIFHSPDIWMAPSGKAPYEDFSLLSSLDHVIISMGTFAWWAGYLSRGDVYYHVEFDMNHERHNGFILLDDYYPETWRRIL